MRKLFILYFIFLINVSFADQWEDPSFEEMIDSSIAIIYGKILHGGSEYVEVKIEKVFKGIFTDSIIYVTGFSGRLGPEHYLKNNEHYYFFIRSKINEEIKPFLEKILNNKRNLFYFKENLKFHRLYKVWTPTSGFILSENNRVHADLVFNRYYREYYAPLNEKDFERLLISRIGKNPDTFIKKYFFKKFENAIIENNQRLALQYYYSLYILNSSLYNYVIDEASSDSLDMMRYLTAKYLSNVRKDIAEKKLLEMLNDEDGFVQGEVIRQLKYHNPDKVAPALLKKLAAINDYEKNSDYYFSSGIMDPSPKIFTGTLMSILDVLAHYKYEPAIEYILPLLDSADYNDFDRMINTLNTIRENSFLPYIENYINKPNKNFERLFSVIRTIKRFKNPDGKKYLMDFYKNLNKRENLEFRSNYIDYLVNAIASYEDEETREFILDEFSNIVNDSSYISKSNYITFLDAFLNSIRKYKIQDPNSSIYEIINLNKVEVNEDSLLIQLKELNQKYDSIQESIMNTLKYERISSVSLSFNDADLESVFLNFDGNYYGISILLAKYSNLPDSTLIKAFKVGEELGFEKEEISVSDILKDIVVLKKKKSGTEKVNVYIDSQFSKILNYYFEYPEKEFFLKLFHLYLERNEITDTFLEEFISVGKRFYDLK